MGHLINRAASLAKRTPGVRRLGRRAVRSLPDWPWTIRIRGLGPIRIRLQRDRDLWTQSLTSLDDPALGMLEHLIRPNDVVFDVGANIGLYARIMIQWFGAEQVVAFEPMSENVQLLRVNVAALGDDPRIKIFDMALGDRDGREALQIDDVMGGSAVLDRVSGGEASVGRKLRGLGPKTEVVDIARLDTLFELEHLQPPDVIKIDTEGAAGLVLAGGIQTIDRHGPRMLISVHGVEEFTAVLRTLGPLGYACAGSMHDENGDLVYGMLDPETAAGMTGKGNILCSRTREDIANEIGPLRAIPDRAARVSPGP